MNPIEPFAAPSRRRSFFSDLSPAAFANALIGFIFAASGPVAIILAAGGRGGLDQQQLASWLFGVFFINAWLTIAACWLYRMPLVFFWTIPGTVLVGAALEHLSFAEVVGAYYVAGLSMMLLGMSGWVRRAMQAIPMPVVMGMVAGVFLQFGVDWVLAVRADVWLAGVMTATFFLLQVLPALGRRLPPLIGALLIGIIIIAFGQRLGVPQAAPPADGWLGLPSLVMPVFSWQAMFELVVPLTVTVLVVQNGQGIAVLKDAGHRAPINFIATACGVWSLLAATVGSVSTCLTGPVNALISSSGARQTHYAAGVLVGGLALLFGVFAPAFTYWMLAAPASFIATLAGLALFKVLQNAFAGAFAGEYQAGALASFLVTVADVSLFNIGAPFWGLVVGYGLSRLLARSD